MPQAALKSIKRWIIGATTLLFIGMSLLAWNAQDERNDDKADGKKARAELCREVNQLETIVKEIVLLSFSNTQGNTNLTALPSFDQIDNESFKVYLRELETALNSTSTSSDREKVLTEYVDEHLQLKDC